MRRGIALVLLIAILASSCMSAPRTISSPRTYIPMNRPDRVWITDKDGERTMVTRPRILPGDTLFARTLSGDEVWLPLTDIQRVQARQLDKRKTLMVVGGSVAVAGLFFALAAGGGDPINKDDLDRPEQSVLFVLFRSR
jgi:hypothetical protein